MLLLLLLCCSGPAAPTEEAPIATNATTEPDWADRFCREGCGNEVKLYRDSDGVVQVVHTNHGMGCMRAPARYMKADGTALYTISHRPVTDEERAAIQARRDALLEGLLPDEAIDCPGPGIPGLDAFRDELRALACPEACAGTLTVFRNAESNAPELIRHRGDVADCSHPPDTYVLRDGTVALTVESRPVTPSESAVIQAEIREVIGTRKESESFACD